MLIVYAFFHSMLLRHSAPITNKRSEERNLLPPH